MAGWDSFVADVAKLAVGFFFGLAAVWSREAIVKRIERNRKRRALWEALGVEQDADDAGIASLEECRRIVLKGYGMTTQAAVSATSSTIARELVELDPSNARAYIALITTTELATKAGTQLGEDLERWISRPPEERSRSLGLVDGQMIHVIQTLGKVATARLSLLRVLRTEGADVVVVAERLKKRIDDLRGQWASEYVERIGYVGEVPSS